MSSDNTEVAAKTNFDIIRYAQCWEDADILMEALNIQKGDVCLGIASAGENCLSKLVFNPKRVIAVDMNPAQLACLQLRVAAYKKLDHQELLELIGSRPSEQRLKYYKACEPLLDDEARAFWQAHLPEIHAGIGGAGKFERYFNMFRSRVIPFIHTKRRVRQLLKGGDLESRRKFYNRRWNNLRWRFMFRVFFSRWMMGRLGRDPAFFAYVEGSVADRILERTRHALCELDPADNPYLHWIMTGTHGNALPFALRAENFDAIRNNIDRLEWRLGTVESVLEECGENSIDKYNLSDIFEYMSEDAYKVLLQRLIDCARPQARLAYWNMLAPRSAPPDWSDRIKAVGTLGPDLLKQDKAFFYSAFHVEELV